MKKKISFISDSRASHSLYLPVLDAIDNSLDFEYQYIITGMHLSEKFGHTLKEIQEQGYKIAHTFPLSAENTRESQVKNIAESIHNLTDIFVKDRPDYILAQGDRGITLAAAIVGNHLRIPVIHMHGGEISRTVDEPVRHAITRFAHIHAAATQKSAERLLKMGEEPFRVHVVGATGIESINDLQLPDSSKILMKYHLPTNEKFIVVLQHPVSGEENQASAQMQKTLNAAVATQLKTIIIYPNSDPGHKEMIQVIEKNVKDHPDAFLMQKNIPYLEYLAILKHAACLIGNSSGGIIESPSLGIPTINIGTRQLGRERAHNILDVNYNEEEIKSALEKALSDSHFKHQVSLRQTPYDPYGDGKASMRILEVIRNTVVDEKLLTKSLAY